MTLLEIKDLIDTNIPDNTTGLITPAKERQVMKAIADFVVSSQGEADTAPFVYDPAFTYASGDPVIYDSAWYLSLVGSNLNNQPDTSPTEWEPVNAFNTVLSIWEVNAVYLGELTIVIKDDKLYLLDRDTVGADPYVSTDFASELAAGDWINLLPNTQPVANSYADTTALIAAQGSQVTGYFYKAGTALYYYLGTTVGDITDYYEVTGTPATPTPPVAAVYADTAAMFAAQGSQITNYLYQAGTAFYRYKGTTVGDITDYVEVGGATISQELLGGFYRFDTATGAADPGSGKLRFNAGTAAATTAIYIDPLTDGATDISNYIKSLKTGDVIYIQNKDTAANWVRFRLTADAVDSTGYYTLAVAAVDGSGTMPGNNEKLLVLFDLQNRNGLVQSVTGDGVGGTSENPTITQYPADVTTNTIDWTAPKTFGSFASPITGTLTESNTNAKRVVQVIFYSGASFTAPSANWKLSANSADYATSGVNIIYVEYFSDTYKRYWFDQDV